MSRLIVKNLPKNIKEERMDDIFSEMGQITDLQLKYTKHGVFRRFAFVGFKTQTEAQRALKHFNNSFIDTSKIQVDICKDFGDDTAPRPWSKYSEKSSAFKKKAERVEKTKKRKLGEGEKEEEVKTKKEKKNEKKNAVLGELEDDNGFQEFLEIHKSRSNKPAWSNDVELLMKQSKTGKEVEIKKEKVALENSSDDSSDDDTDSDAQTEDQSEMDVNEHPTGSKEAANKTLSDMDYLKKKVTSKEESIENETVNKAASKKIKKKEKRKTEQVDESENTNSEKSGGTKLDSNDNVKNFERKSDFTIKLRGLPFHAKEKDITEFLSPLKIMDIRMTKDEKNRPSGRAYVDLESKDDLKEALSRHKDYIKGRYIEVFEDKKRVESEEKQVAEDPPWMKNAIELANNEDLSIAETGRLYLRNLSYSCTEEELSELFCKYGPTTEVFVPFDKHTNKSMGFAFVTFMMPEHAVQAFNELDGHVFQGRLLHILPAKPSKTNPDVGEVIEEDHVSSSYKKNKKAKVASLKSKDHNWNTLFLGVNAVAEIMANKYNSRKSDILDVQSKGGLALRLALGETQVVAETKDFLVKHGVKLDAFGQPEAKRSKTVIIVKNLQHGTKVEEIENLFSSFGHLGKVILPPTGVTALVEFQKLSSASKAFEKIAYTKLKNVPLYLEWAPADVFDSSSNKSMKESEEIQKEDNDANTQNNSESDSEPDGQDDHVVFVKNLNFDTDEDTLKQLFTDAGKVSNATIAKKQDLKKRGSFLSMGYGFVEYKNKKDALNAVKQLQNFELDGHKLQLKMSNKKQIQEPVKRKSFTNGKQKSSKILVRNVPFEATQKELRELFGTFGELKTVRLPKKLSGTGPHRGFAFIDFLTKQDAKRAFKSLCTSTHLYGRRLVLEWAEDNESIEELRKKTADYFHEPKKKTKTKDFEAFNNE